MMLNISKSMQSQNQLCTIESEAKECSESEYSVVPLIFMFASRFILGIGNTLYFSLGQSYLDDNVENKTSTPVLLAIAFSLRLLGPFIGFFLGFASLKVYIDPTKTPIIDSKDPRWLGAWWLGWIIIGIGMTIFSVLIGLFPKELPKKKKE